MVKVTTAESQAPTLRRLPDARNAIDDLRREPAAAIFASAHARLGTTEDDVKHSEKELQKLTDDYIAKIDRHLEHKEKEIMTV